MSDVVTQLRDWLESQKTLISSLVRQSDTAEKAEALRVTSIAYTNALNKLDSLQSDADTALRLRLAPHHLTPMQMRVALAIARYWQANSMGPTLQELADGLGVSKVTIFEHTGALVRKGALIRKGRTARALAVVGG